MKPLSLAVLALLLLPMAAEAQNRCHSDQERTQHANNLVVTGNRSILPKVEIGHARTPHQTFGIKGTFCDSSFEPLPGQRFELIRYEREEGHGVLRVDDLTNGTTTTTHTFEVVSMEDGKFVVTGLPPGHYAIRADWSELPQATPRVVFDVRLVPGPSRESPVAQAGLLQPL